MKATNNSFVSAMKKQYKMPDLVITPMMPYATILNGTNLDVDPSPIPSGGGGD